MSIYIFIYIQSLCYCKYLTIFIYRAIYRPIILSPIDLSIHTLSLFLSVFLYISPYLLFDRLSIYPSTNVSTNALLPLTLSFHTHAALRILSAMTFINGYRPLLQNSPLKSSKSNDHTMAPAKPLSKMYFT